MKTMLFMPTLVSHETNSDKQRLAWSQRGTDGSVSKEGFQVEVEELVWMIVCNPILGKPHLQLSEHVILITQAVMILIDKAA